MGFQATANAEPVPGYRLIDRLGGGGFGEVWKAEAPGGLHKAVKIIHGSMHAVDDDSNYHALQELKALKRLQAIRHPYLLSLERYDIIDGRLFIVMELADCNLWDRFKHYRNQGQLGIPRAELLGYLRESAEVLDMMNKEHQLQHLDIKPQNLFLVYNHVKVADFGLVKDLEGIQGTITGGVTPVYAAPETFNGTITRFCDQYSLAIVYQELLTGVRPFAGTTGQQLLFQHLKEAPNLAPLPPADRAAVGQALAKEPSSRFPTCMDFVNALQHTGEPLRTSGSSTTNTPVSMFTPQQEAFRSPLQDPMETPHTQLRSKPFERDAVAGTSMADFVIPVKNAPPEITGNGALRPAIIIGAGGVAMEMLKAFRIQLRDQFGDHRKIQTLKLIYIDTDSTDLQNAIIEGAGALLPNEVVPARLNRPAHYLKPRRNGRSLIEGWFDASQLYKIPRNPVTNGMRSLGRLAFLDHYRVISDKLSTSIQEATTPDAITRTDSFLKLGMMTNRPIVYVVAGLGGGSGSGMMLDLGYMAQLKLRHLGYQNPEVVGICLLPAAIKTTPSQAMANSYTALREIFHFSQPDTTFKAQYEDKDGAISESAGPFSRCMLVPIEPGKSGRSSSQLETRLTTVIETCDILQQELFSNSSRGLNELRKNIVADNSTNPFQVLGLASYCWPQHALLSRSARWLSASVLSRWLSGRADIISEYVQKWLHSRWESEQLLPKFLMQKFTQAIEQKLKSPPKDMFSEAAEQFIQKGWFAKDPDPIKLQAALSRLVAFLGMPDERSMQRTVGTLENFLEQSADNLAGELESRFLRLAMTLFEHPDYRLIGALQATVQVQEIIESFLADLQNNFTTKASSCLEAYYAIFYYLNPPEGAKRSSNTDLGKALHTFAVNRYESLIERQAFRLFSAIKQRIGDQQQQFQFSKTKLEEVCREVEAVIDQRMPTPDRMLLPKGYRRLKRLNKCFVKQSRRMTFADSINSCKYGLKKSSTHSLMFVFQRRVG
ncbi:MAG: tubulin-like doman-containing protein [Zavarzinella sp.]